MSGRPLCLASALLAAILAGCGGGPAAPPQPPADTGALQFDANVPASLRTKITIMEAGLPGRARGVAPFTVKLATEADLRAMSGIVPIGGEFGGKLDSHLELRLIWLNSIPYIAERTYLHERGHLCWLDVVQTDHRPDHIAPAALAFFAWFDATGRQWTPRFPDAGQGYEGAADAFALTYWPGAAPSWLGVRAPELVARVKGLVE